MVGYCEIDSGSKYGTEAVEIFCASDASASWKIPARRKPNVSLANLTILPAPALALLAHSLRVLSAMHKAVRGVDLLLILSEEP